MESIIDMAGDLNVVLTYYTLDEDEIDNCYYHAEKLCVSQKRLLNTRCSLTIKLLRNLFDIVYKTLNPEPIFEVPDSCLIGVHSSEDSSPAHIFLYLDGVVYHSYAMIHTLRYSNVDKFVLKQRLKNFRALQNTDNWKALTGVKETTFSGEYKIRITNITKCDLLNVRNKAKKLVKNALTALKSGHGKYLYDDYTYILSFGTDLVTEGEKFLLELLKKFKD